MKKGWSLKRRAVVWSDMFDKYLINTFQVRLLFSIHFILKLLRFKEMKIRKDIIISLDNLNVSRLLLCQCLLNGEPLFSPI